MNVHKETLDSNPTPKGSTQDLLDLIINTLEDNKAVDITILDLIGKSSIADYMVVATGTSKRQVSALADYLSRQLKKGDFGAPKIEGLEQSDWVLLDAGDIIVHIFKPEVRNFYNLEKMWSMDLDADNNSN